MPELGDYLGDLTDETPNNSISTFVTGGPKNYAYHLEMPDEEGKLTHCKVRGITLNFRSLLQVNFDTLKDMITNSSNKTVTVTDSNKICRDRDQVRLLTVAQTKDYRTVFDKRVRKGHVSYPYGY